MYSASPSGSAAAPELAETTRHRPAARVRNPPKDSPEDLLLDDCREWQRVEELLERPPELDGVALLALVVETVDAVDLATLVVTSE